MSKENNSQGLISEEAQRRSRMYMSLKKSVAYNKYKAQVKVDFNPKNETWIHTELNSKIENDCKCILTKDTCECDK